MFSTKEKRFIAAEVEKLLLERSCKRCFRIIIGAGSLNEKNP